MDCVGCEKCKMWAKLQLLGIATSLKILFSTEDCSGAAGDKGAPHQCCAFELWGRVGLHGSSLQQGSGGGLRSGLALLSP
jgi:hypothetical protein